MLVECDDWLCLIIKVVIFLYDLSLCVYFCGLVFVGMSGFFVGFLEWSLLLYLLMFYSH